MGRLRFRDVIAPVAALFLALSAPGCGEGRSPYVGTIKPGEHPWLKGKKIFIDPGHGGKGGDDPFRRGPHGVTEEEANLRVSLILQEMLEGAGAIVGMSRRDDEDVPLDERARMAAEFGPHLLLSVHHNGSMRRADGVNYSSVLYWGTAEVNPAGHDLAAILSGELEKVTGVKGAVYSDFAIFGETGTRILRRTRDLCPGVIGEGGFFSDEAHARKLKDLHYLEDEAGAYFLAVSKYLHWGIPTGEIAVSCALDKGCLQKNCIASRSPLVALVLKSGNENEEIDESSLSVTLDGLPVRHKKICRGTFAVDYGKELYPGTHRVRFSFRNLRRQNSMVLGADISVRVKKGDYRTLTENGTRLVARRSTAREGLLMLLAARSMGPTDPGGDRLMLAISNGFAVVGERAMADYYSEARSCFYPGKTAGGTRGRCSFFPRTHMGKSVTVRDGVDICGACALKCR